MIGEVCQTISTGLQTRHDDRVLLKSICFRAQFRSYRKRQPSTHSPKICKQLHGESDSGNLYIRLPSCEEPTGFGSLRLAQKGGD